MMQDCECLPRFIVFEGLDGAGTTTQTELFRKHCEKAGIPAEATCEPTDGFLGRTVRSFLKGEEALAPSTAAFLFAADRNEHLFGRGGVQELLSNGKTVVCDRYFFSSLAYQSVNVDFNFVKMLNSGFPLPEFLFFLEVTPEIGETRLAGRNSRDIYERLDFQRKVHENYRLILNEYSSSAMKTLVLDGTRNPESLHEEIWSFYREFRY